VRRRKKKKRIILVVAVAVLILANKRMIKNRERRKKKQREKERERGIIPSVWLVNSINRSLFQQRQQTKLITRREKFYFDLNKKEQKL